MALCGWLAAARADTYELTDGGSVSGTAILYNDAGITLRTSDESYTNVVWPMFSQPALKQLAENPKI